MKKLCMFSLGGFVVLALVAFIPTSHAATIDLTTASAATGTPVEAGDGSIWSVVITSPTGTGVYEPFLRLQENQNKNNFTLGDGIEAGLNTDAKNPGVYNDVGSIWTHSLLWGNLLPVVIGQDSYYSLTFDVNEPASGAGRLISLDQLALYSGTNGDATSIADIDGRIERYNFGNSADEGPPVLLDYTIASSGSGRDDFEVLIPYFAVDPTLFFYAYVEFGGVATEGYLAEAGFEEVRANLGAPTVVPEAGALLLFGSGLIGLVGYRRVRRMQ